MLNTSTTTNFPLLVAVLTARGRSIEPFYTMRDAAQIFNTTTREIKSRIVGGQLIARDLFGRDRFLSADFEDFLAGKWRTQLSPESTPLCVKIYLPAKKSRPKEMTAYRAVMAYLEAKDSPLPLIGYSGQPIKGGFRLTTSDTMERDTVLLLTVENWKPASMTQEHFKGELRRIRDFIYRAYAEAGCPQTKILVTTELGADELN